MPDDYPDEPSFEEALDEIDPLSMLQVEKALNFFVRRQHKQVTELRDAGNAVAEARAAYERALYTEILRLVSTKTVAATASKDCARGKKEVMDAAEKLYLAEATRDMVADSQRANRSNIEALRSLMTNLRPLTN